MKTQFKVGNERIRLTKRGIHKQDISKIFFGYAQLEADAIREWEFLASLRNISPLVTDLAINKIEFFRGMKNQALALDGTSSFCDFRRSSI